MNYKAFVAKAELVDEYVGFGRRAMHQASFRGAMRKALRISREHHIGW
jgi:hypothetical protein